MMVNINFITFTLLYLLQRYQSYQVLTELYFKTNKKSLLFTNFFGGGVLSYGYRLYRFYSFIATEDWSALQPSKFYLHHPCPKSRQVWSSIPAKGPKCVLICTQADLVWKFWLKLNLNLATLNTTFFDNTQT